MRTSTQLMTALHVVLLIGKKTAEDTLQTAKLLMEHGLRDLINEADSLGATRFLEIALENSHCGNIKMFCCYSVIRQHSSPRVDCPVRLGGAKVRFPRLPPALESMGYASHCQILATGVVLL